MTKITKENRAQFVTAAFMTVSVKSKTTDVLAGTDLETAGISLERANKYYEMGMVVPRAELVAMQPPELTEEEQVSLDEANDKIAKLTADLQVETEALAKANEQIKALTTERDAAAKAEAEARDLAGKADVTIKDLQAQIDALKADADTAPDENA